tara:strand:+ start:2616 stop:3464 length:849 start_codon:yes stop_codon:yes gene_type:complete
MELFLTDLKDNFFVKFWGVRGSIPCPGSSTIKYGGNTSCLEIGIADKTLIFDAGTGLCQLGQALSKNNNLNLNLFLTHFHYDHIWGWPFFEPALRKTTKINIYAAASDMRLPPEKVLMKSLENKKTPVNLDTMKAELNFSEFIVGKSITLTEKINILTTELSHPDKAVGYRIQYNGKSICYLTDHEHNNKTIYNKLVEFVSNADIVIYDATYTNEEYAERMGWGHSTWEEGVRLCDDACAKTYVAFHHDPSHDDKFMDNVSKKLKRIRKNSLVAKEGLILKL